MAKPKFRKDGAPDPAPHGKNAETAQSPASLPDLSSVPVSQQPHLVEKTNANTSPSHGAATGTSIEDIEQKLALRRYQSQPQQQDPFLDRHPLWRKYRKEILTLFICYNVISVGFHLCAPGLFRDRVLGALNPYLWYTGLWQDFCVFVPNPKDYNVHLTANVHFKGGQIMEYKFPNPADDNQFKRMTTERYRKWVHDNVNAPVYKVWWPDTCKWIARKYKMDAANPPIKVELIRHWTDILPPGSPSPVGPSHVLNFYTYELRAGDLQ